MINCKYKKIKYIFIGFRDLVGHLQRENLLQEENNERIRCEGVLSKQFELSNYDINTERWLEQLAKEVKEQIGYPFQSMLELGAGNGGFARAMSNLNVK